MQKYKSNPDPLLRELTGPEIYSKFINSLNKSYRTQVSSYIQMNNITKNIEQIERAIKFADDMLNPKH